MVPFNILKYYYSTFFCRLKNFHLLITFQCNSFTVGFREVAQIMDCFFLNSQKIQSENFLIQSENFLTSQKTLVKNSFQLNLGQENFRQKIQSENFSQKISVRKFSDFLTSQKISV